MVTVSRRLISHISAENGQCAIDAPYLALGLALDLYSTQAGVVRGTMTKGSD
jgi:hypothetical protein